MSASATRALRRRRGHTSALARISPSRRAHRAAGRRLLRGRSPRRPAAVEALDAVAIALGRGLLAGAAATAAMTVASTAEMKLRRRPPSTAPAKVAGKLLGVKPRRSAGDRFATVAHATSGVALGTTRGLLDLAGVRGPAAPAAFFAIAWTPELIAVPAAGAAPPPWRWGALELTISAAHHAVYAAAGEATYRALATGA
ncbi:MAG TPA: hypothetical protein VF250_02165 [Conexibacter sp.]